MSIIERMYLIQEEGTFNIGKPREKLTNRNGA